MARHKEKETYSISQEKSLCELLLLEKDELEKVQANLARFGLGLVAILDPRNQEYYVFFQRNGAVSPFGINSHYHLTGFLFRNPLESETEFVKRRQTATEELRANYNNNELTIEVFSPTLFQSLIRELEASPLAPAENEEEDLETVKHNVLKYLQQISLHSTIEVTDDNRHWSGEQVNQDKYLVSPTDILINWRQTSKVHPQTDSISMWGWETPKHEKDPLSDLIPYGNVIGIVVVPNSMGYRERKKLAKEAMQWHRDHGITSSASMILTVDANLLNRWKQRGSAFISSEQVKEHIQEEEVTPKTMEAYGFEHFRQRSEPPEVSIDFWEPEIGSHIGSPQIRVTIKWDETYSEAILIDWGWIFSLWKSKSFIDFPSPTDGLTEFLKKRLFRPVKRLYRTDLIIHSLDAKVIENLLTIIQSGREHFYTIDEFIALEIYHRLGQDGMLELMLSSEKTRRYTQQLMKTGGTTRLFKYLQKREQDVYAQKTQYHGLFITHAHQDHTLGSAIIRPEVTRYFSAITQALLQTDFLIASRWLVAETAAARNYAGEKVGRSYQVNEYPYEILEEGVRVEVAPGIVITAYSGSHSVPGELGFVWEIYHKGKLVTSGCYGGDDKNGEFYRRVQEHVKNISPIDLAVIEGTNDDRTRKVGAFTTEENVKDNFSNLFVKANHENALLIVDILKNNSTRLFHLVAEGMRAGRTIVLSPKIAFRFSRLEQALSDQLSPGYTTNDPVEAEFLASFRQFLYSFYSGEIKIWKRNGTNFKRYEKEMFDKFGTIGVDDLSSYYIATEDKYLLIREAGESERKIAGIASKRTYWVRSAPDAFDDGMREELRRQSEFARNNNMIFITTGFHASGHGVNLPATHPLAEHGLLHEVAQVAPGGVVVAHTQGGREHISKLLKTYPQLRRTTVYTKLDKPNPIITPPEQFTRWNRGRN